MTLTRRAVLLGGAIATGGAVAAVDRGARAETASAARHKRRVPPGGIAIVMNSDSASISIVDMATRRRIRTESVLRQPHHWTLSPDGSELWVGDAVGNALFSLNPRTGAMLGHRIMADPYQLWVSPNGQRLCVNALRLNHVDVYDAETFRLIRRYSAYGWPSHLTYSPDSSMVYSTLQESGKVIAIDLVNNKVAWRANVGPAPAGIVWHDGRLLVSLMNADGVAEINPTNGRRIRFIHTGRGAHIIQISPDHRLYYVTDRVSGTIIALDTETLQPVARYIMDGGPDCIAFAPDGRLWISRRWTDTLAVLDPTTGAFDLVNVGRSPHGVFLSPMLELYAKDGRAGLGFASV